MVFLHQPSTLLGLCVCATTLGFLYQFYLLNIMSASLTHICRYVSISFFVLLCDLPFRITPHFPTHCIVGGHVGSPQQLASINKVDLNFPICVLMDINAHFCCVQTKQNWYAINGRFLALGRTYLGVFQNSTNLFIHAQCLRITITLCC